MTTRSHENNVANRVYDKQVCDHNSNLIFDTVSLVGEARNSWVIEVPTITGKNKLTITFKDQKRELRQKQ